MNVLFAGGGTGGHLYPALAIARALRRREPAVRAHFIGAHRGIERDVLPTTGFPFTLVDAHPLYRSGVWRNWRTLVGGATAWRDIGRVAAQLHPDLVVGTGGYASAVALAWAAAHGVPIVQHIGDSHPGATARLFARFSTEAYLGFPEAEALLPHGRCTYHVTGNPIEPPPDIHPAAAAARARWGFPASARVLLVFGASQGARAINVATLGYIERGLPPALCVLWVTGKAQYDLYRGMDRPDVRVVPYVSPMAEAYAAADIALSRGGMMSTSELCAWGIPSFICPLPTAAHDHQTSNAKALARAGAAIHMPQAELTPERLAREVDALLADPARLASLARGALARARPFAADEIAGHILRLMANAAD
ncbi:MAG TPA: UDP-N-acetylglucosamine--N-acetylmuramyl-(pentapeptide) pyrophosphoryl-undecaprenol N-acetylglucosamine transferase [Gemmatimonadaceae bacterium]|nr:UDP-N-acetylglucosamine--N-acetylmuramyl-(pentapeptide) pyrophosphoryl-undecaprenol N-acetylglucosamine transferase [Gemmatimonadaceae bacterium]